MFFKNPRIRLIVMGLLILIVIGYYVNERRANAAKAQVSSLEVPVSEVSPKASPTGGRGAVMRAMPEEKKLLEAGPAAAAVDQAEPVAKPKPVLLADGKVRTVLAPGETLVTGGYLNAEGKWEFSMVTTTVREEGGEKLLQMSFSILALDDASVGRAGLANLLTGEVQTRQHGEVWKPGEAQRILKDMMGEKDSELVSSPSIVIRPGNEGMLRMGSDDGVMFQMETKADVLPDGNLDLTVSQKRQAEGK